MNIGIIGTSDIATKAVIPYTNEGYMISAIASRSFERAKEYAQKYGISKVYGSYKELLNDLDIDSVYIALPPAMHSEWVCKALLSGKHVLVEKPICLNTREFGNIVVSAECTGKHALEGIMIRHHPWMMEVADLIRGKTYGKVLKCYTRISMRIPTQMAKGFRSHNHMGGGVLYDELPYWLCINQTILGLKLDNIKISVYEMYNNVPWKAEVCCEVGGIYSTFFCSYDDDYRSDLEVEFEHAILRVKNFFRASMGDYKINLSILDAHGEHRKAFPSQNYYRNQMTYFVENIENVTIHKKEMELTKERINALEKVMNAYWEKGE